jgi:tetratricopeptide (TPR) repeat protein
MAYEKQRRAVLLGILALAGLVIAGRGVIAAAGAIDKAGSEAALRQYQNNETAKAVVSLKAVLAAAFSEPASGQVQEAVTLAKSGKPAEAEKILQSVLDNERTAARARYELGLIYESAGKIDEAAVQFRNALVTITNKGAKYVGRKNCKDCHLKQYKSWAKTKMARTFDVLKPGARAEAKVKLKFDPKKDYTKDAKCLPCHTTGFGLAGGYKIDGRGAKDNEGTTCEACHGPGSKYVDVHKEILKKKRPYNLDELAAVGEYKVDAKVCTRCHNRRNPTVSSDFHFEYEKYKAEDTHQNFPPKYLAK